jgi:hypothetical protein
MKTLMTSKMLSRMAGSKSLLAKYSKKSLRRKMPKKRNQGHKRKQERRYLKENRRDCSC